MNDRQEESSSSDDMSEYLQIFLDESDEQLEDLVETMLLLERNPSSGDDLNEAFRLIHSIKGSAGMLGLESITILSHHLESHFERLRSGSDQLDRDTMNLVLRCIDFLRECTGRLRSGQELESAAELLEQLKSLGTRSVISPEDAAADSDSAADAKQTVDPIPTPPPTEGGQAESISEPDQPAASSQASPPLADASQCVTIHFEANLPLADLKARLIVSRLSALGELTATRPDMSDLDHIDDLTQFLVVVATQQSAEEIRSAVDLDGVESIDVRPARPQDVSTQPGEAPGTDAAPPVDALDTHPEPPITPEREEAAPHPQPVSLDEPVEQAQRTDDQSVAQPATETTADVEEPAAAPVLSSHDDHEPGSREPTAEPSSPQLSADPGPTKGMDKPKARVGETMRVDIDRLDNLMNLAGELVVNRARFVQASRQLSPDLKKTSVINRIRDFGDGLRRTIDHLQAVSGENGEVAAHLQELKSGLSILDEQSELWEKSRRCFGQITEAIDQLSRVSDSLQRGVLGTRMVPVAPLFNRFQRVVRDLSLERGKKVNLRIRGESTELDKRMIDELGDPLVHLVRNSIDHGLESPEVRRERGKPEIGTIFLEASHSGNNVYIHVRDDGRGIDLEKIRQRLVDNRILPSADVEELSDEQVIDHIWHPGFSTASEITDVSGRGVGMDVVKTRIHDLNGTIDVQSNPDDGTVFSLRLPLTLAIINSLLVRIRDVVFALPIDDVREIVSLQSDDIVSIRQKQTFDVRGEFIPLVGIDDVFLWHNVEYAYPDATQPQAEDAAGDWIDVVILQSLGKTMGLRVDALLGSQDIVIKSLSENFVDIRGLSGASILGDGTVCLMLDVGRVIEMAILAPAGN